MADDKPSLVAAAAIGQLGGSPTIAYLSNDQRFVFGFVESLAEPDGDLVLGQRRSRDLHEKTAGQRRQRIRTKPGCHVVLPDFIFL